MKPLFRWKHLVVCGVLSLPLAAQTPTLVTHGGGNGSVAISTTGATFFAVCTANYSLSPPSDSLGNTYQLVNSVVSGNDIAIGLYVSYNPATSSSTTFSGGDAIVVSTYTNIASGPDKKSQGGAAITPANANELVLSCGGAQNVTAMTASSPLTTLDQALPQWATASAYQIQGSSASSVTPSWNYTSGGYYTSLAASFYSNASPAALALTTTSLPEAAVGQAYNSCLAATGGIQPYTWSLASGTLPAGLNLSSSTGCVTGT